MQLSQVLDDLMRKNSVSAYKISKETGISDRLIGYWRNGDKLPSAENLLIIANYFGISVDYLLTGKENVFSINNLDEAQKNQIVSSKLNENEQEMLSIFNRFTDREQIKIIGKLEEWFAEKQRRAIAAQNQSNIQTAYVAARSSDKHPPKTVTGNFSDIENAPDVTDEY